MQLISWEKGMRTGHGIYTGMPEPFYRKKKGISQSIHKLILKNRYKYKHPPIVKGHWVTYGKAHHCLTLTEDQFDEQFIVTPWTVETAGGEALRNWKAQILKRFPNRTILTAKDAKDLEATRDLILESKSCRWLMQDELFEAAIFWAEIHPCSCQDPEIIKLKKELGRPEACPVCNGSGSVELEFKGMIDIIKKVDEKSYSIGDLKTCQDASPEGFQKSIGYWGYDFQLAAYIDGFRALTENRYEVSGFFIPSDRESLFPACYELDDASLRIGRIKRAKATRILIDCLCADYFPAYRQDRILKIGLSKWEKKLYENL